MDLSSPMLKYLEIASIAPSRAQTQDLRVVGQIIALANYSDQLVGSKISWVELDPDLSKSLGFHFDKNMKAQVGDAYGVVSLPEEYLPQLKAYERVDISRYGLLASKTRATVISIQQAKFQGLPITGQPIQVVIKIQNGQDWYPGTNCVVFFPMLGSQLFNTLDRTSSRGTTGISPSRGREGPIFSSTRLRIRYPGGFSAGHREADAGRKYR